ncbi:STAS domain-containing protein [Saccharopolyspora erythraea]|uniref:STAS domain-containing protein n=1 Tax=Saccharopolyspora erythraea TaxID=1836 RepID=UPI001BA4FC0C|nr:STAS domain-containing protein [Saccharopolyspora erythraea]QUH02262.1 STAS domain-containing protein [Saccharopolyspora erythraea]
MTVQQLGSQLPEPVVPSPNPVPGVVLRGNVFRPQPDALVMAVEGEVSQRCADELEAVLRPRPDAAVRYLVVDLSRVHRLGIAGLQLLTRAYMTTRSGGIGLRVVVATEEVRDALRTAGLDVVLDCRPNVAAALVDDQRRDEW